jgi:hypothetical protein
LFTAPIHGLSFLLPELSQKLALSVRRFLSVVCSFKKRRQMTVKKTDDRGQRTEKEVELLDTQAPSTMIYELSTTNSINPINSMNTINSINSINSINPINSINFYPVKFFVENSEA